METTMPSNTLALVKSIRHPDKLELRVNVTKSNFKEDFEMAISWLNDKKYQEKIVLVHFQGCFFDIEAGELRHLLGVIKTSGVSTLDFSQVSGLGLGYYENKNIQETFDLIAAVCSEGSVKAIKLSRNGVGRATPEKQALIIEWLKEIALHVEQLNLSLNELGKLNDFSLKDLFSCFAQSSSLKVLVLDDNFLVLNGDSSDFERFQSLFIGKNKDNKWQYLSLSGTGIALLSDIAVFLKKVEECCEGIGLSYNALQAQTSEGRSDPYEDEDLIKIISDWLKDTKLTQIDLTHNDFSERNTKLLKDASKSPQILLDAGNGMPNNPLYDELLLKKQEVDDDLIELEAPPISSSMLYMSSSLKTAASGGGRNIQNVDLSVFEESVARLMQTLSVELPVMQQVPKKDVVAALIGVCHKYGINVASSRDLVESPNTSLVPK
jgi:hypothetical protein